MPKIPLNGVVKVDEAFQNFLEAMAENNVNYNQLKRQLEANKKVKE